MNSLREADTQMRDVRVCPSTLSHSSMHAADNRLPSVTNSNLLTREKASSLLTTTSSVPCSESSNVCVPVSLPEISSSDISSDISLVEIKRAVATTRVKTQSP